MPPKGQHPEANARAAQKQMPPSKPPPSPARPHPEKSG